MNTSPINTTALCNDHLVLTANERIQRHKFQQLGSQFVPTGPKTNTTTFAPDIYSLDTFLKECWLYLQDRGYQGSEFAIITGVQEIAIWRSLLATNDFDELLESYGTSASQLINKDQLISHLINARKVIDHWQIATGDITKHELLESKILTLGIETMREACRHNRLVTPEQALVTVIEAVSSGVISGPKTLELVGFSEISPLWQKLFDAFDCQLINGSVPAQQEEPAADIATYATFNDEIDAAANWCEALIPKLQKNETIVLVVPNLSSCRQLVEQRFNRYFDAEFITNPSASAAAVPYDISASSMLVDEPIIGSMLDLLAVDQSKTTLENILRINSCPFWGDVESEVRLVAQKALLQHSGYYFSSAQYLTLLSKTADIGSIENKPSDIDQLETEEINNFACFQSTVQYARSNKKKRSLFEWREYTAKFLSAAGWPGVKTLNSREYQATEQLRTLLETVEHFGDFFTGEQPVSVVSFSEWLNLLQLLLSQTPFHTQTLKRPIQILGILEAVGLEFTHGRVINLTEDIFPTAAHPNPLIPFEIQKRYSLPRSTPERELLYAKQLFTTICANTTNLTLSYHQLDSNGTQLKPSPLLPVGATNNNLFDNFSSSLIDDHINAAIKKPAPLSRVETSYGPQLSTGEAVKGGSYRLQLHNANPFYAFATYDLKVQDEQIHYIGIPPYLKGTLIHSVLGDFWSKYKNSTTVKSLDFDEIKSFIRNQTSEQLRQQLSRIQLKVSIDACELFATQIADLLIKSIEFDIGRSDFSVIAIEKSFELDVLGYQFKLRVDRIDTQGDHTIIIDYKSSNSSIAGMQKQPLADTQLPIYSSFLFNQQPISAISYFNITPKLTDFQGIGLSSVDIKGIRTPESLKNSLLPNTWNETLSWWQQDIELSTQEIADGYVANITRHSGALDYMGYLSAAARDIALDDKEVKAP